MVGVITVPSKTTKPDTFISGFVLQKLQISNHFLEDITLLARLIA
jgi:hypothetical protein